MKRYLVALEFSDEIEVEAESESEACDNALDIARRSFCSGMREDASVIHEAEAEE